MGRAKLPMKLIENPKSRNTTFIKRRKGLKKKIYEFSTLCGVDACLICFASQTDGPQKPETWPEAPSEVERIIQKYKSLSKKQRDKRKIDISSVLEQKKKLLEELENQTDVLNADDFFSQCSWQFVKEFENLLEKKLGMIRNRIESLKLNNVNQFEIHDKTTEDLTAYLMEYPQELVTATNFNNFAYPEPDGYLNCSSSDLTIPLSNNYSFNGDLDMMDGFMQSNEAYIINNGVELDLMEGFPLSNQTYSNGVGIDYLNQISGYSENIMNPFMTPSCSRDVQNFVFPVEEQSIRNEIQFNIHPQEEYPISELEPLSIVFPPLLLGCFP